MTAYYNEFEPYAAEWLRNLIKKGLIADGEVDERSIADVRPDDLRGFTQCHFFAGIGGWSYAARLAGWPDERPLWTGSCPCQPFSVAGRQEGTKDERHLWPEFFRLIAACRPDAVMGEQVAAAVGKDWLDGVFTDLEGLGYACGAAVIPACAVNAPHRRDRLWFVADAHQQRRHRSGNAGAAGRAELADGGRTLANASGRRCAGSSEGENQLPRRTETLGASEGALVNASSLGRGEGRPEPEFRSGRSASTCAGVPRGDVADTDQQGPQGWGVLPERADQRSAWSNGVEWIAGHDGKARRVKSGIRLLANGVPARVGKLRALGNAIVPQVAAEVIAAYMETRGRGFDGPVP